MSLTLTGGASQRPVATTYANTWTALQTFTNGLTVSAGTTALQGVSCTTLTTGGNVGIGVAPGAPLDVLMGTTGRVRYSTDGTNGSFQDFISEDAATWNKYTARATQMSFLVAASGSPTGGIILTATTPGTAPAGQVLIGGGAVNAAGGITCTTLTASSPTAGIGYATGAGGAVTQGTSRTTGVTLNTVVGTITLFSAAGSTTAASFTVTNSAVAATDVIHLAQKTGSNKYVLLVTAVAAGSFQVTQYTTGGTATEAPVINFAVIKGVAA